MKNGRRGPDFERQVFADLAARGALCVRSAGSRGIADVVAFWPSGPAWLVQAKINGKMKAVDARTLGRTARAFSVVPVKASRPKRGKILYERYHSYASTGFQWSELEP
jgi:Holliday junction resolvase